MQRKMPLVRQLLEYTEMQNTEERMPAPEFDGYSEAEVHYHLGLCEEAGYLILHPPAQGGPPRRFGGITRLTWKGHETLDAMRSGQ